MRSNKTCPPWNVFRGDGEIATCVHTHLEVVELEGFGFVGVKVIAHEADPNHDHDEQHNSNSHPRLVTYRELENQSQTGPEVKGRTPTFNPLKSSITYFFEYYDR